MKTLSKNEWIATVVAIFVVGFFFVFGQMVVSLFSEDTGQKISQVQDLSKQDLLIGGGDLAETGNTVVVHYVGKFSDGRVFDSSVSRGEPMQFVLGDSRLIEGFNTGIEGMRVGGKRIITIPPHLGYGMNDSGFIPGGSTLIFEVELLKVTK